MAKPRILILGATGQVGKLICQELQHQNEVELIVPTRNRDAIKDLENKYGKVVYLDLDDPSTFSNALNGIERLFLLTGYSVAMVAQSKTIIDAALTAGVKHIVHLGVFSEQWDVTVPHFIWHQMIEVYIRSTPLKWTFLHPNCFLQNLIAFSVLKGNEFCWYTTQPCGWIALEDVAACAAKILVEGPDVHHGKDYWFSTESLDVNQVADVLTEVLNTKIIAKPISSDLFISDMGIDPKTIDPYFFSVAECCKQIEDGRMDYIGDIKDDVQTILNRNGMNLREWASLHKQELLALVNKTENEPMRWGGD